MSTPRTPKEITVWLVKWIAKQSKIAESAVDVEEPFVNLGLSSRQAVMLSGDLEDWLGVEVLPSAAWDHPTVAALATHLAAEQQRAAA